MCDGLDQPLLVAGQKNEPCQCLSSASSDCRSASSVLLSDPITVWLWHCHTGRSTNFWLHTPLPLAILAHHSSVNVIAMIFMITILQ